METTTTVSDEKETAKLITRVRKTSRAVHDDRGGGPKYSRGWFETLDNMEVQVLAMCDGTNNIQDILAKYIGVNEEDDDKDNDENDGEVKGKEPDQ